MRILADVSFHRPPACAAFDGKSTRTLTTFEIQGLWCFPGPILSIRYVLLRKISHLSNIQPLSLDAFDSRRARALASSSPAAWGPVGFAPPAPSIKIARIDTLGVCVCAVRGDIDAPEYPETEALRPGRRPSLPQSEGEGHASEDAPFLLRFLQLPSALPPRPSPAPRSPAPCPPPPPPASPPAWPAARSP